ncbi:MAG: glycosyltransferase [Bacteroidales bacterium]|nr:glycosyltransferase [Bacteroidales bacterium]
MVDLLFNRQILPLVLLGCFVLVFIIQQFYYWVIFWRLGRYKQPESIGHLRGVSVVICARNEYHHLSETLPLILEQDYPEYEVLVVNHSSDDDTHFLLARLEEKYPHLSTIHIREDLNFFTGKKFPLSIGIKSAKHDLVLLTDADCKPASKDWIRHMQSAFQSKTEVVLGYGSYNRQPGLTNKLIRFDTAQIASTYLSYAMAGIPYMGVGRNLSYLKQVFYKNQGFITHYRVRSGDDDLFINRAANRSNTKIMVHPASYTFSEPKPSFGKWITQKKRHLLTSHHYKFKHKALLGLYAFSQISFYLLFVLLVALNWSAIPVLGMFLLRLISQYIVFSGCLRKLNEKDLVPFIPIYELMLLIFNSGILISNVVRKPTRWK